MSKKEFEFDSFQILRDTSKISTDVNINFKVVNIFFYILNSDFLTNIL